MTRMSPPSTGRRLVLLVVVAVVDREVGGGEHRMEAVDRPGVDASPACARPSSSDGSTPRRRPTPSCHAGTGGSGSGASTKSSCAEVLPQQARLAGELEVLLQDAADEEGRERGRVQRAAHLAQRCDQGLAVVRPLMTRSSDERASLVDRPASSASRSAKWWTRTPRSRSRATKASCSSRARCAHRTSSKSSSSTFDGVQPGELEAGPVDDDLAQRADLGVDVEAHAEGRDASSAGRSSSSVATILAARARASSSRSCASATNAAGS